MYGASYCIDLNLKKRQSTYKSMGRWAQKPEHKDFSAATLPKNVATQSTAPRLLPHIILTLLPLITLLLPILQTLRLQALQALLKSRFNFNKIIYTSSACRWWNEFEQMRMHQDIGMLLGIAVRASNLVSHNQLNCPSHAVYLAMHYGLGVKHRHMVICYDAIGTIPFTRVHTR